VTGSDDGGGPHRDDPLPADIEALVERAILAPDSLSDEERTVLHNHPGGAARLAQLQKIASVVDGVGNRFREGVLAEAARVPAPEEARLDEAMRRLMDAPRGESAVPIWRRGWVALAAAAVLVVGVVAWWPDAEPRPGDRDAVVYLSSEGEVEVDVRPSPEGGVILRWSRTPGLFARIAVAGSDFVREVDAPAVEWNLPRETLETLPTPTELTVELYDVPGGSPSAWVRLRLPPR